ncbi:MAG: hypothetical protein ACK56I_29085, partial [bacterium]
EGPGHAGHQPRAEQAAPIAREQTAQQLEHQREQHQGHEAGQAQHQRIALLEQPRVAAGRHEQAEQDHGDRHRGDQRDPKRARYGALLGVSGLNRKRFHSELGVQSRLVSALTWKGLGS